MLPIEIINKIFMYLSSPISKLLHDELLLHYYFTMRIIENNNFTLYTYWIKCKLLIKFQVICIE